MPEMNWQGLTLSSNNKTDPISAIEKARTVALQKSSNSLVRRAIQDIERLTNNRYVSELISKGADVNAKDEDGMTPLHWAASQGHKDIAELLIAKGADVNAKTSHSARTQNVKRYDPYARYEIGDVIYKEYNETLNVGSKNVEHFRGAVILKVVGKAFYRAFNCDMLEVDYTGGGVFRKYVDYKKKTRTQILLPSNTEARGLVPDIIGADVNTKTPEGSTPLHLAADEGHKDVGKVLIAKGADLNAKNAIGSTPLNNATQNGHKDMAELLIAKGADVNAKDAVDSTPLKSAVQNGHKDIAELLIANGADVNAKDVSDSTPLHFAADEGHKDIAELLIAKGADVNVRDVTGLTPLNSAAQNGHKDIAELLIAKGADVNAKDSYGIMPLHEAVGWGDEDVIKLLIAKGADVNAKEEDGVTPLHWAALEDHMDVAELLIAKGADVNAKDEDGMTPLHWAAQEGYMDVAELLIAKGADVNAKDNGAMHLSPEERLLKAIFREKAALDTKNKNGATPLHWAVKKKHMDMAKLLRKYGARE